MPTREEVLEAENRALRAELQELRARCTNMDSTMADIRRAVDQLEEHAGLLENLFVASSRLHGSPDVADTMRAVSDILRDLLGARRYVIFLEDDGKSVPILRDETDEPIPAEGAPRIASVELKLGDRRIGTVEVFELFAQKGSRLTTLDRELLDLVGSQAAPALLAARALAGREVRTVALRDFVRFLMDTGMEKQR